MTHASLFSGIGGFDLAAEWAGWINLFNCEIDEFCRNILKHYWPNAQQYSDIRTTDFTVWRGRVDVLTGGFPCQPFSLSGKRKGTEDERYLWPEMLRAIREIQPRWIVGENVRGIINWSNGMVFDQVCADLEAADYEVQPYLLPVAGVDGIITRNRIWFIAYSDRFGFYKNPVSPRSDAKFEVQSNCEIASLTDVISYDFRSESNKHGVIDGVPVGLDECSFKGYGNAVSPVLVYQLFDTINQFELTTCK